MLTAGNLLPTVGSLTYVDGQVTFAISPRIRGISLARKILLADDSVTAQNMGRKILADAGYEVIAVNNGSAALKKIAELKPDLVILDVYMPGYSGLEVCQRLKESQETARIPVLLTVGKLEPFKPEEAQRVRAEGYIVKPFEASELLSALSKLEDKVVPRSEPSKPGRFARAIALADEASQGRKSEATGAGGGWQSRLGMPHAKAADENVEESSIDNPMNRDLRTVVDNPTAEGASAKTSEIASPQEAAAETNVDVGALAPAGLPKDVTAEELAAIAAAAAQIQMASAALASEAQASEIGISQGEDVTPSDSRAGARQLEDSLSSVPQAAASANGASAINASDHGATEAGDRQNGEPHSSEAEDVPVTMAAASESHGESAPGTSRWTAVAVALESDEASISLDHEMKAHAAFAAAEVGVTGSQGEIPQSAPAAVPSTEEIAHADAPLETAVAAVANSYSELTSPPDAIAHPQPELSDQKAEIDQAPAAQLEPAAESTAFAAAEQSNSYQIIGSTPPPAAAVDAVSAPQGETTEHFETSGTPAAIVQAREPAASTAITESTTTVEAPPLQESESAKAQASGGFAPITSEPEPKLDAETVKSTAAAWASWRQIRDTGKSEEAADTHHGEFEATGLPAPAEDINAKAVAAGAEQIYQAEAAPGQSPSDVASIVDSVLADLRPKLMEEISRKMAEKK